MLLRKLLSLFQVFVKAGHIAAIFAVFTALNAFAGGAQDSALNAQPRPRVGKEIPIIIDANVPVLFQNLIRQDLASLEIIKIQNRNASIKSVFQTDLTNEKLQTWLYDRSRYILSEQFEINATTAPVFRNHHKFANPIIPQFEKGKSGDSSGPVRTVMSNVGAKVYFSGKTQNALFQIVIPGYGNVPVRSPRVGIFKIGSALFAPLLADLPKARLDSLGNSLARLKTYFHEARHSDGNGDSLLFGHAVCPEGHDFAGYNACDKNLNGPYTVGALFLSATINSCSSCSAAEREALRVQQADSFSRVIKSFNRTQSLSSSAAVDSQQETCNQLRSMKVDLSRYAFCNPAQQGRTNTIQETVKSQHWDANPESAGPIE